MQAVYDPVTALLLVIGTALATGILIVLLKPLLTRYALARPNARSSHTVPTPQGGGIAIVITVTTVIASGALHGLPGFREIWVASALGAMLTLAAVGALDDIRPLPIGPRLVLQFAAAAILVLILPGTARVLPGWLPHPIEQALLVVALVWFINLTNFMDGIDWMTVAEAAPICLTLAVIGMTGLVPVLGTVLPVLLALLGGLIGFAPFNRHVARLFLGDVGSLPIGALLGWLLILLATAGHPIAALILPMYYLADATITLVWRWWHNEPFWQAHRKHFYQVATARGLSVPEVTARVLILNVFLGLLACLTVIARLPLMQLTALTLAVCATAAVLVGFQRGRT